MTDIRPVPGFPRHFADEHGRVYARRGQGPLRLLVQKVNPRTGYRTVKVSGTSTMVHRLVAAAFHGPRPAALQTRHLNGNPLDNRPENLRYGTALENCQDKARHGRVSYGIKNGRTAHADEVVQTVVALHYDEGLGSTAISRQTGISLNLVSSWIHGWSRSHSHDYQTPHGRLVYRKSVAS